MARRKSLRSQLYRAARDLGNVEADARWRQWRGEAVRPSCRVHRKTNTVTGSSYGRSAVRGTSKAVGVSWGTRNDPPVANREGGCT
jgi:hypothetical protein